MSRMVIFAWLVMVLITANTSPALGGDYYSDSHIVKNPATLKKTHLHFFMHDTLSGNNPSAIPVVKRNGTDGNNIIPFGTVNVFDDWLTVGPHPSSKIIGNARGMYTSTSRGPDLTVLLSADFEFTSGRFNGSSISVFSRDPVAVEKEVVVEKEVAVVGGRGKFRMAKGFILINVISLNVTNGDAILECHATIFY